MRTADTNVLLGLIVDDRPRHSAFAEAALSPASGAVLITEGVLVEAVSVLCWSYGYSRADAAGALLYALAGPGIVVGNRAKVERALRLMCADGSLGLVDCLLIESTLSEGHTMLSFDARARRRAQEYVEL